MACRAFQRMRRKVERAMGIEPTTSSLGSLRSTTELRPRGSSVELATAAMSSLLVRSTEGPEMFRQLEPLALVIRADALAIDAPGGLGERLVHEPSNHLAMFKHKRHFVGADLQHGARALPAARLMAKSRIEKTGIVNAELSDERIERHHFGSVVGGDPHGLPRSKDIELAGIED